MSYECAVDLVKKPTKIGLSTFTLVNYSFDVDHIHVGLLCTLIKTKESNIGQQEWAMI